MKRITLPMIVLVAASSAVLAQDPTRPPTPPAKPAPAAKPASAPRATPAPRLYSPDFDGYISRLDIDAINEQTRDAMRTAMDQSRIAMDQSRIDVEQIREQTRAAMEAARPWIDDAARSATLSAMTAITPMAPMPPLAFNFNLDRADRRMPPQGWAPADPADSLYRVARDALNRGDYGRAARMFADIQKNYSRSAYQTESQYWEAWARYKIGTTDELHQAAKLLEPLVGKATANGSSENKYYNSGDGRRTSDNDILTLYARINGALAMRGDHDAAAKVERAASTPGAPCDQEDQQVRTEALNALSQMDPAGALPYLRKVLDRKDECSAPLRTNAVFMLGRRTDPESAALLMSIAKSDPNMNVRTSAINFLARIPGDAGLNALEDMLKNEQDERIQRAAVHALMQSDNPRAHANMGALIARKDAPVGLRIEAINSFNSERATTDDASYLRGLFSKADNDQIKNAIVNAVSRIGGPENDQWVMGVVHSNESSSVKANALARFVRSTTVATADLAKLYDESGESLEIRRQVVSILGQRRDQAAADKLYDIVKTATVVSLKMQAMNALANRKDPRAVQLLTDILDGKTP
jgi:HEAT repeat protein/TolA-binding protein